MHTTDERFLMTRQEAAEFLKLSPITLAKWASTGQENLPFFKLSNRVRYDRAAVVKWMQDREQKQTP